jgi:hypothetical protein
MFLKELFSRQLATLEGYAIFHQELNLMLLQPVALQIAIEELFPISALLSPDTKIGLIRLMIF